MSKSLLLACFLLFVFLVFGCKPQPREIPPMPDFVGIEIDLGKNLDRDEKPRLAQDVIQPKIEQATEGLALCEQDLKTGKCDARSLAQYHLLLGDLFFNTENFPIAEEHFQHAIITRYEAFEADQAAHDSNLQINKTEREKQGEKPNLLAGAAFLNALFALNSYKDYAEMVRAERRLSETHKRAGQDEQAAAALARAQLGLKKAMEYRRSFETEKRVLIGLMDQLGTEFQTFDAYIKYWDSTIDVPKI